ncbi:MAG: cation diffusion facilitator family transporter [Candidatus Delongbacteria bacterium]|nr:cation diffusion facilitator family transporter [Candidatus Delongbacteria bacterium]
MVNKDASVDGKIDEINRITYASILINVLLSSVKIFTGIIGNSKSAVADGVHSLSDLSTDLAILIGVKFWTAPPDENHPYGHGRIETLVTVFIGIILIVVGLSIGYEAISTLRDSHLEKPKWISLIGIAFSIILKELLFRWTIRVGKMLKSSSLIANAWHHRSDSFSSIPALIAVSVSIIFPGLEFIDHIGAVIVAFIIIKVSLGILFSSFQELTDCGISKKDIDNIKSISMQIQGVKEVHAVRSRKYNSGNYIDLHVLVDESLSVKRGHDIAEEVKVSLIEKGPSVVDAVVHIEPFQSHSNNDYNRHKINT